MIRERTQSWEAQQWESAQAYWAKLEPVLNGEWMRTTGIAEAAELSPVRAGTVLQWAYHQRLIERRYVDARSGRVCHASGAARAEWRRANNSHE